MKQMQVFLFGVGFLFGSFLHGAAFKQAENPNYRLSTAILIDDVEMARKALDDGAQINQGPIKPLMMAASKGRQAIAHLLLERGAFINTLDTFGQTALMCAAHSGQVPVLNLLIQAGADLNLQDRFGLTALMIAAEAGRRWAVEQLLAAGADPIRRDPVGRTAAQLARAAGNLIIADILDQAETEFLSDKRARGA